MTTYQQLSEVDVIDRVIGGDIALFEVLIRRYNPYLYKIGRSYRFNHEDVEDLMQETFIHAFENLSKLENQDYFKTWITRIMLNECYRKTHKASSIREVLVESFLYEKIIPMFSGNNNTDTEKKVGSRELNSVIEKAIGQIPISYRLVFTLRTLNGLSVQETATVLGISETNVKARLNRAKVMLRRKIEQMYTPEDIFEFNLVYCDKIVSRVMKHITK